MILSGQTILIVEAEFLIALDIQRVLESMGASQTVFARNTIEAINAASRWQDFGLALVEMHSDHDDDFALAEGLEQAGIKLVFTTSEVGLGRALGGLQKWPLVMKPFTEENMARAIETALATDR